jgi:hypothetical protein
VVAEIQQNFKEIKKVDFIADYQGAVSLRIISQPKEGASILPRLINYLEEKLQLKVKHN